MNNLFDILMIVCKYKKIYEKRCLATMKKYDLRIADIEILYYVSHSGSRNLSKDIADIGMSKANVSKAVEHLRCRGFVNLVEDTKDRRCLHIEPTDEAQKVITEVTSIRKEMEHSMIEGITEEDKKTIFRVFHQINENIMNE